MSATVVARGRAVSMGGLRKALRFAHRWLALLLTPVFLAVILSGAVLSLKPVVAEWSATPAESVRVDVPALVALMEGLERLGPMDSLSLVADGTAVDVRGRAAGLTGRWDLASAARRGEASLWPDVFRTAERLHKALLLGLAGVVEAATYVMLAVVLVGPLLAWLRFRNTLLGWHTAVGWLLFPLIALSPATAILMTLHVGQGGGPGQAPRPSRADAPASMSAALALAAGKLDLTGFRGARRVRGGVVMVQLARPGPSVHMVSGRGVSALTRPPNLVKQLHEGTWGGAWSGLLNLLASGALLLLTVTGLWSWLARAIRRRRRGALAGNILVAYASQTGTAARLATATRDGLVAGGESVALAPLGSLTPAQLRGFPLILLVASTTGDGEVPDGARRVPQCLAEDDLSGARIAVLALGERHYAHFCRGGVILRDALVAAGAREALPLARVDGDPKAGWSHWIDGLRDTLRLRWAGQPRIEAGVPVHLRLLERQRLDNPTAGETRETWGLAFAADRDVAFRPGDLLRLTPPEGGRARAYSIGSSSRLEPRVIRLTVGLHSWRDAMGSTQLGEVSGFLVRSLAVGGQLVADLQRHPAFNPPEDEAQPLLMIATGTGIAPFPGFVAERAASGRAGPAWLIFGNRHRAGDHLWAEAFGAAVRDGSLTRCDTVFSRDSEGAGYVQHCLREAADEVVHWLQNKQARVYICGAGAMARAVEETLTEILAQATALPINVAAVEIARWRASGRLRVDAFD